MGRYGVTIKNPVFTGITYEARYNEAELREALVLQKAMICARILEQSDLKFPDTNTIKFNVNYLVSLLKLKIINKFKSWVENDTLYIDDVKSGESKWSIEDSIELYEDSIDRDLEGIYVYCLSNYKTLFPNVEPEDLVGEVVFRLNKYIEDFEEILEIYIAYKLAHINYDNIIPEEEESDLEEEIKDEAYNTES